MLVRAPWERRAPARLKTIFFGGLHFFWGEGLPRAELKPGLGVPTGRLETGGLRAPGTAGFQPARGNLPHPQRLRPNQPNQPNKRRMCMSTSSRCSRIPLIFKPARKRQRFLLTSGVLTPHRFAPRSFQSRFSHLFSHSFLHSLQRADTDYVSIAGHAFLPRPRRLSRDQGHW